MRTYQWEIYNKTWDTIAKGYLYEDDDDKAEKRVQEFYANTVGAFSYCLTPLSD